MRRRRGRSTTPTIRKEQHDAYDKQVFFCVKNYFCFSSQFNFFVTRRRCVFPPHLCLQEVQHAKKEGWRRLDFNSLSLLAAELPCHYRLWLSFQRRHPPHFAPHSTRGESHLATGVIAA